MLNMWDERFKAKDYIYGKEPNQFFYEQLNKLPPGKILLPGEGEGRNAVFAALQKWDVSAFDQSLQGKRKAMELAFEKNCSFIYDTFSYLEMDYNANTFDAIGLFYTHMPLEMRIVFHANLIHYLKPGGIIIMEAFSKEQLNYSSGGPDKLELLFSEEEIKSDFSTITSINIQTKIVELNEGHFHKGKASVIRMTATK